MIKFKDIFQLTESNEMPLSKTDVESAWHNIFPNSTMVIKGFGNTFYCNGYLAKDKSELTNGYWQNDILSYSFNVVNGNYSESATSINTKPAPGSYLAYGRIHIRKKTIPDINIQKLTRRFNEIKQMVISVKNNLPDNLLFNINDKI